MNDQQPIPTPRCDYAELSYVTPAGPRKRGIVPIDFARTLERELVQKEQQLVYSIALQRAIEHHCNGEEVSELVAVDCPHHAKMLNKHREALQSERDELKRTVDCLQRHNDATVDDSQLIAMARERDQLKQVLEFIYTYWYSMEDPPLMLKEIVNHSKSPTQ